MIRPIKLTEGGAISVSTNCGVMMARLTKGAPPVLRSVGGAPIPACRARGAHCTCCRFQRS
jgi:hypothetical protein